MLDIQVYQPTSGKGNEGSGDGGGGYVRPLPPEYYRTIYRHSSNTGAMYGGGAASADKMVGASWT